MRDPLLDESDALLEQELLRAGRDVELSPATRAKILATLGIVGGVASAGKAAASNGLPTKLASFATSKSGVLALAGVVSLGAGAWSLSQSASPADAATRSDSKPAAVSRAVTPDQPQVAAGAVEREPAAAPVDPVVEITPTPAPPKKVASKLPSRRAGLADELRLVERASKSLRSGQASEALTRLAEYRRRFSGGKLALEAQVLRIEALASAGQSVKAEKLARAFLKRHPDSLAAARVRRHAE